MDKEAFNILFGRFIQSKRLANDWTQSDLADKIGNNFQNISRLERGEISCTLFWFSEFLAPAFGQDASDFIKEFKEYALHNSIPS